LEPLEEVLGRIENSKYVAKCALFRSNGEPIVSHIDEETTKIVKPFFDLDTAVERTILEKKWSKIIIARLRDYVFVLSSNKAPNLGVLYLEFEKALNTIRESLENKTTPSENHETVTIPTVKTVKKKEQETREALINIEKLPEANPQLITRETVFSKTTSVEKLIDSLNTKTIKSLADWILIFYMHLNGEKTLEQVAQEIGQNVDNVTKVSQALLKMGMLKIKNN
jgi:hypothetical protein